MKPTILIVHGPMAAGKSTITSQLEKELDDFLFVDRAYIKNVMLSKLKDRELAKELSKKTVYLIMKGLMQQRKNIMLQEQRAPSVKKKLEKDIKKYRYRVISFYLQCSVETAKKRDVKRQKRYVRPRRVELMHEKHGYADPGDILIDTEKNSIKQTVNIIKTYMRKKNLL